MSMTSNYNPGKREHYIAYFEYHGPALASRTFRMESSFNHIDNEHDRVQTHFVASRQLYTDF